MTRRWWAGPGGVAVIVGLAITVYTTHGVLRYLSFHSTAYDLGFFDQIAANLSAGRGWQSSFLGYDFRGQHWEPIMLAWAQLYRVAATPLWLVVINAVALGLAPLAAWRLARAWLGATGVAPFIAALATALSPLVVRTAGFDYHSEALTPVLALLALEAATRRRWLVLACCCAALLLLKEDALLVVAGIGWLLWCRERHRGWLLLTAGGLAGFTLLVSAVMPRYRGGATSDLLARYAYLGGGAPVRGPADVVVGLLGHPALWIGHLLGTAPVQGLAVALVPLALLPLLSGWSLLAPLPVLLVALLSADPFQAGLQLHYGAEVFPLLLACSVLGWGRARRLLRDRPWQRPAVAAAAALAAISVAVGVNLPARLDDMRGLGRSASVAALLDRIPAGAAVSASTQLVPHLSERASVTEFPDIAAARWVAIDDARQPSDEASAAGYSGAIAALGRQFHVVAAVNGVTLWQRP